MEIPQPPDPRPIFVDALNLAYWCGSPPTLRVPLSLAAHLLSRGHRTVLYFDASARYQLAHEVEGYQALLQYIDHVVEVPSRRTADAVMLRQAKLQGAGIVSRDRFRDHRKRHRRLIDDPTRLLSGGVKDDRLLISSLAFDAPLFPSCEDALLQFEASLEAQPVALHSVKPAEP